MIKLLDYVLIAAGISGAAALLETSLFWLGLIWLAAMFRYSGLVCLPKN